MYCTSCGAPLASGARFCSSCGVQVQTPPPSPAQPTPNPWSAPGAPPAAHPSPPRGGGTRRKQRAIIGSAVLAVVTLVLTLFFVLGGGSNPQGVVEDALEAAHDGDYDKFVKTLCSDLRAMFAVDESDFERNAYFVSSDPRRTRQFSFEIGDVEYFGESARVEATFTVPGALVTQPFDLDKEHGDWCISAIVISLVHRT